MYHNAIFTDCISDSENETGPGVRVFQQTDETEAAATYKTKVSAICMPVTLKLTPTTATISGISLIG